MTSTGSPEPSLDAATRIRGCLLGGAAGDALGAPLEFLRLDVILAKNGPEGVRDFLPVYGRVGAITDDTQMTLFTVEGLIRARVRQLLKGITDPASAVHNAYYRWFATQKVKIVLPSGGFQQLKEPDGWLA